VPTAAAPVTYEGVELTPEVVDRRPFYFVGDEARFRVRFRNLTDHTMNARIPVQIRVGGIGGSEDSGDMEVRDLAPGATKTVSIGPYRIPWAGQGFLGFVRAGNPETAAAMDATTWAQARKSASATPLVNFTAVDRGPYEDERRSRLMQWLVLVALAGVAAVGTVVLVLR
jgi:hypothetical protein